MEFGVPMTRTRTLRSLKTAAALAAALAATGCESLGMGDSDTGRLASQFYRQTFGASAKVSRETPASISFASIGVNLGGGDQAMMVLGTARNGVQDYYSANRVMIEIKDGRIAATGGLPYNLTRGSVAWGNPLDRNKGALPPPGSRYALVFDFGDLQVFGVSADCAIADAGAETITVIGAELQTRHFIETCESGDIGWDFTNEFWADAGTGFIWRSIQNPHPKLPSVTIEVFRPAQG